mmetsp:Transcript_130332/g.325079  ORF Transcript_130332/g.325079 Transcript_130332/m.325079 type:complete len:221 (-) Transcript_130332:282-944(-)
MPCGGQQLEIHADVASQGAASAGGAAHRPTHSSSRCVTDAALRCRIACRCIARRAIGERGSVQASRCCRRHKCRSLAECHRRVHLATPPSCKARRVRAVRAWPCRPPGSCGPREPPPGWREAAAVAVHAGAGGGPPLVRPQPHAREDPAGLADSFPAAPAAQPRVRHFGLQRERARIGRLIHSSEQFLPRHDIKKMTQVATATGRAWAMPASVITRCEED